MGTETSIQWCHHTANTWWGCTKVSDGCKNCYAERDSKRRGFDIWGPRGSRRMIKSVWTDVRKWAIAAAAAGERRRVFWGSMMDVCEDRPELLEPRKRFCGIIEELEDLDFLILSKRPENYCRLMSWGEGEWPRNAWAGTSAENQDTLTDRLEYLLCVRSAIHWLSAEPQLGPLDFGDLLDQETYGNDGGDGPCEALDWVIVGGESGAGSRPFNLDWARSIIAQCKAADVACFVKQLGAKPATGLDQFLTHPQNAVKLKDAKGGDMAEWPEDLRVRQFPEVARV